MPPGPRSRDKKEHIKVERMAKHYEPLAPLPYGFLTTLARELGKEGNRMAVTRAVNGQFSAFSPYLDNFLAIRAKACEMLGIENPDRKEGGT